MKTSILLILLYGINLFLLSCNKNADDTMPCIKGEWSLLGSKKNGEAKVLTGCDTTSTIRFNDSQSIHTFYALPNCINIESRDTMGYSLDQNIIHFINNQGLNIAKYEVLELNTNKLRVKSIDTKDILELSLKRKS